jgi:hypothetical protein
MDLTTEIKREMISAVLSHKDIFLNHGIILEDFNFEISKYKKLLEQPFLKSELSACHLRIPFKGTSKSVFEFSVFLNLGFEPNITYYLYQSAFFPITKPEVSLETPFSEPFVEENFNGSWQKFKNYAFPILKEYFQENEIDLIIDVVGIVVIEVEPYIKYTEIII